MMPDGMTWVISALQSWEAICRDIREKGGCPHYLERAERTADHYRQMVERARTN